ncbi:MAG: type II secretion system protein GspF [Nitrospinae bacterium CG11_big_fil_rev_8_21_14_0_20_56_8]|nr:MAG: type II secretion system protein GspF [Nitrospinae bacterium CG11_big_fil_rev_8_21_14_0_20_56_8]
MAIYFYKATDRAGKFLQGNVEAEDYRSAVEQVRGLNCFPIEVTAGKPGKQVKLSFEVPEGWFRKRIPPKELMEITQQLATLVESGFTLDKSLILLSQLTEKPLTRNILTDVQNRVHGGSSLADAIAEHPHIFSKLYINMIRAGEAGGTLAPSLTRLATFMEKTEELKANVRSAMVYPSILFLVGGAAVAVLITVVIPQFSKLFEEMGQALPLPTQILLALSSLLTDYWMALVAGLAAAGVGFTLFMKNEKGRLRWDGFLLHIPLIGDLIRKIEISRFSRTMATLLQSGVPVLQALTIVSSLLNNRVIASAMTQIHKGLKGGRGLSGPLQQINVFPPLAVHMITIGEQSGELDEMLSKVSQTYDKEVERSIKQLISLIEPIMILFMALIIGFIVISILLAIFSVNDISF